MSYSDVDHFSSIVSGCESLVHGDPNSPDARYAFTVLKLHAGDAGLYAGQEGFMEAVKKGANASIKWIKELITSIKNYLRSFKDEQSKKREAEVDAAIKQIDKSNEKFKSDESAKGSIQSIFDMLEGISHHKASGYPEVTKAMGIPKKMVDNLGTATYQTLLLDARGLRDEVISLMTKYNHQLEKEVGSKPDNTKLTPDQTAATKNLIQLGKVSDKVQKLVESIGTKIQQIHKATNKKAD